MSYFLQKMQPKFKKKYFLSMSKYTLYLYP